MNGWRSLRPAAPQARFPPIGARTRVALPRRRGGCAPGPGGRSAASDPYSRLVALLKLLLPAVGLALLLLVAAWPRLAALFQSVGTSLAAIDLREARELKMVDPRYAGSDRQNRPYVLTAAIGRQMPDRTDLLSLERPRADMTTRRGTVTVTAATGIYQAQTKLLDLFRRVSIVRQDGTRFATERAHVDFSDNAAEGHDPVSGSGPWGAVAAQGFRILDRGARVIFTGKAALVLKGAAPNLKPAAPPSLPPAVAAQAAAIEAAAANPAMSAEHSVTAPHRPAPLRGARHHAG